MKLEAQNQWKLFTTVFSAYNCTLWLIVTILSQPVTGNGQPTIQEFQFPKKLVTGEKASVTCMVRKGKPPFTFVWLKDSKEISNFDFIKVLSTEELSTLTVSPIQQKSSGNYTCRVKNPFGTDEHSTMLTVTAPPSWLIEPESVETTSGQQVHVRCSANGFPTPTVKWIKASILEFPEKKRHEISAGNGSLFFSQISEEDAGEYVCEAYNGVETPITKTIMLTVHECSDM